jgi:phage-related minor tail protein
LRQGVKRLIVELIKAVALAAILSTIDGGASSATGLTSVIGKLLGFKGFRANGGPVGAGNAYLIGERGPELFVPGQNGRIMNNSAMIGAGGMQIIPTLEFSYDNLRIAFNRANASAGRRL